MDRNYTNTDNRIIQAREQRSRNGRNLLRMGSHNRPTDDGPVRHSYSRRNNSRIESRGMRNTHKSSAVKWFQRKPVAVGNSSLSGIMGGNFKSVNFQKVLGFNGESSEGSFMPNPNEFSLGDKIYEEENEAKSSTQQNDEYINLADSLNQEDLGLNPLIDIGQIPPLGRAIVEIGSRADLSSAKKVLEENQVNGRVSTAIKRLEEKYSSRNWNESLKFNWNRNSQKYMTGGVRFKRKSKETYHNRETKIEDYNKNSENLDYNRSNEKNNKFKKYYTKNLDRIKANGQEILSKLMEDEKKKLKKFKLDEKELSSYKYQKRKNKFRHTFHSKWRQEPIRMSSNDIKFDRNHGPGGTATRFYKKPVSRDVRISRAISRDSRLSSGIHHDFKKKRGMVFRNSKEYFFRK